MKGKMPQAQGFSPLLLCCTFLLCGVMSAHAAGVEKAGRWLRYNGDYPYFVGVDLQRLVSWTDADYLSVLDEIQSKRINFIRIWVLGVYMDPDDPNHNHIHAYPYSNGKYDFDEWNDAFWTRFRDVARAARDRDIVVNVSMLNVLIARFDRFKTPFDKNDNGGQIFSPKRDGDLQPEWYDLDYSENGVTLRSKQQALIDKTLAELDSFDNVIFEIQNENGHDIASVEDASAFQNYWAAHVASKTSRLVMVHAHHGANQHTKGVEHYWDESYNDILNFHFYPKRKLGSLDMVSNLLHPVQSKGKVLFDNEGWPNRVPETGAVDYRNLNASTRHNWAMFTSGGYGAFFNLSRHDGGIGDSAWEVIAKRLTVQRNIVETVRFWEMSPVDEHGNEIDNLVHNGPGNEWQVIANLGNEYLVFFCGSKGSNDVEIDLPPGNYNFVFYSAENGTAMGSGSIDGGPRRALRSPRPHLWNGEVGLVLTIIRDASR